MTNAGEQRQRRNKRTGWALALAGVGMFAFGFALVPLYGLVCDITGINRSGKANFVSEEQLGRYAVDQERTITVEFDATVEAGMPWEFRPLVHKMKVRPGQIYDVKYIARNNSDHAIVGQAVPGITPWQATEHFNKTQCFCFTQQTLQPGEEKEMPLRFVIDAGLPGKYSTVTLSYTFMDTGMAAAGPVSGDNGS